MNQLGNYSLMGWNSFDGYNWSVTEKEMKANTDIVDKRFKPFGYRYIVLDFIWSMSGANDNANPFQDAECNPLLYMDTYGRLIPAPDRFPSSIEGNTLKPLADYIHGKGLKFGIHIMRGVPRQAVKLNTHIKGTEYRASDIAITDPDDECRWLNHMYGIDMDKRGAQEYLNSIFELYAEWEVDLVKVDDITYPYREKEIEGYRKAIDNCGRDMALSLSPGPAPLENVEHLSQMADMWRISADFWDNSSDLQKLHDLFGQWSVCRNGKGFPDGDMIPFSKIALRGPMGKPRYSNFSHDEKIYLMTLLCINNSPLMLGGDLTVIDSDAYAILTNPDVLAVQKFADHAKNQEKLGGNGIEIWYAPDKNEKRIHYIALFNRSNEMKTVESPISGLCKTEKYMLRDLWNGICSVGSENFNTILRPNSAALYRVLTVD